MKNDELKPFSELDHTDRLLRLDWFGGVKCNLDEFDNPLIECIFTPFEQLSASSGATTLRPQREHQFVAGIAVGYLPVLFSGQFFRRGKWVPLSEWPVIETITLDIDVSDSASVTECVLSDLHLDPTFEFISERYKGTAGKAGLKKLHGILRKSSSDKIKIIPAAQDVFIHELELIRYYLTNSSHSCKNLFTGAFSEQNLYRRVVNVIHEEVSFDAQISRGRFVYRHGYKEIDVYALGRILFEPNKVALRAAQRVHSTIVANQINDQPRWLGYPRTEFPFRGKTQLVLSGRRVKTENGFIFFAYRIHSCSAPFPYKSLSYCDEISPGGEPPPPDAPPAFGGAKNPTKGPAHDEKGNPTGHSTSGERPSSASVQLQIELSSRSYPGLKDVEAIKEKLRASTHSSNKKPLVYDENLRDASTGEGTSGESSSTRQSATERIVIPSTLTPDLQTFILVVRGLRTLHADWDISTITVGTGVEIDDEQFSYYPELACQKKKGVMRSFSYTDEYRLDRRQFICVQIKVSGRYVYLFESQRRLKKLPPTKAGSSAFKEDMPILLLRASGFEEILGDDFLPMIEQTIINKTWPNEDALGGYVRDYTVHGQGVQSTDELCTRVAQLIFRNLELK